jgi:hypothetical protein
MRMVRTLPYGPAAAIVLDRMCLRPSWTAAAYEPQHRPEQPLWPSPQSKAMIMVKMRLRLL